MKALLISTDFHKSAETLRPYRLIANRIHDLSTNFLAGTFKRRL